MKHYKEIKSIWFHSTQRNLTKQDNIDFRNNKCTVSQNFSRLKVTKHWLAFVGRYSHSAQHLIEYTISP